MSENEQPMRLGELLLLSFLWMLFGFMLWYYLSVFHGIPVRLAAEHLLQFVLGDSFHSIIPNPDRRYLLQAQTTVPFEFSDGSTEPLGFIINPLIYGYGLPLLFGLVMASNARIWHKLLTLVLGYLAVMVVQIWGVFWQALKLMSFNFGPELAQVVTEAGVSATVIALCYQLGVLIFPPLVPVIIWVLSNWREVEQYTGWKPAGRP